jgi:uncharacterized protein with HEPN domain
MKDDKLYLTHILECIENIEDYTRDGYSAFIQDKKSQDAVIRNFEIMGEATKRISQDLKQAHPDTPWRDMAGFRDVLIHDYARVVLGVVWDAVLELPKLKREIEAILQGKGFS